MVDRETKRLAAMFRALSNPNRLQLFVNLLDESRLDLARGRTHECFLATLLRDIGIGAPSVSHHIRELESAGLIETSKEGKQLVCSVRPEALAHLAAFFGGR